MKQFLKSILQDFSWYRKWRGGVWHRNMYRFDINVFYVWEKVPYPINNWPRTVETEVYPNPNKQTFTPYIMEMQFDIIQYCREAHEAAKQKGWWTGSTPYNTRLLLVISELVECMEADREGKCADLKGFEKRMKEIRESLNPSQTGSYLTHEDYMKQVFVAKYRHYIKGSIEEELADAAIRIFDLLGYEMTPESGTFVAIEGGEKYVTDLWPPIPKQLANFPKDETLAEQLHHIITKYFGRRSVQQLTEALGMIFLIAEQQKVDLLRHVNYKMEFNKCRALKHGGKAY